MHLDKKLYDESFHDWKLIPLKLICSKFGDNSRFHLNLDFDDSLLPLISTFHVTILQPWNNQFSHIIYN